MIEIPGFLKKFGQEVGVQVGLEVVRGFLNEKIKDVKPPDLYQAIVNNQDLWSVTPEEVKGGGGRLKGQFGQYLEKYKDEINVEHVLEWLYKDRPDLHSMIINTHQPSGVDWLEKQVEKIKEKIIREL